MVKGNPRGAIIFAGSMKEKTISRHFSPDEKGTLLEYVLDSVWTIADELMVVFESEPKLSLVEAISPFGAKVLTIPDGQNSLTTLTEAFKMSDAEYVLLTTERLPLLKPNIALSLFENVHGNDLAIPKWTTGKIEPLFAVYHKSAFLKLAGQLKGPQRKDDIGSMLLGLIEQLFDVKYLSVEKELKEIDPELDSFLEVKDEKSLSLARSKATVRGKTRLLKK
ncbi:MAG: molybdenum cofactor guanylyltransferase [Nitrososphaerales archaeon]